MSSGEQPEGKKLRNKKVTPSYEETKRLEEDRKNQANLKKAHALNEKLIQAGITVEFSRLLLPEIYNLYVYRLKTASPATKTPPTTTASKSTVSTSSNRSVPPPVNTRFTGTLHSGSATLPKPPKKAQTPPLTARTSSPSLVVTPTASAQSASPTVTVSSTAFPFPPVTIVTPTVTTTSVITTANNQPPTTTVPVTTTAAGPSTSSVPLFWATLAPATSFVPPPPVLSSNFSLKT